MFARDSEISGIILKIAEHYTQNIATSFIAPFLVTTFSDSDMEHRISGMTEHPLDMIERGIPLDELYLQINAMARFISEARSSVMPSMSSSSGGRSVSLPANESQRILRNMAISNFGPNIDILEQYTKELFEAVIRYDKEHSKPSALYEKIPENSQTARLLQM